MAAHLRIYFRIIFIHFQIINDHIKINIAIFIEVFTWIIMMCEFCCLEESKIMIVWNIFLCFGIRSKFCTLVYLVYLRIMKATLDNPYEKLYREMHPQVTGLTSVTEAEDIARHLGHMYNAVGTVVKDITKILSFCFNNEKNVEHNAIEQEKQQNINSLSM